MQQQNQGGALKNSLAPEKGQAGQSHVADKVQEIEHRLGNGLSERTHPVQKRLVRGQLLVRALALGHLVGQEQQFDTPYGNRRCRHPALLPGQGQERPAMGEKQAVPTG
jgi:hypothetical protein